MGPTQKFESKSNHLWNTKLIGEIRYILTQVAIFGRLVVRKFNGRLNFSKS